MRLNEEKIRFFIIMTLVQIKLSSVTASKQFISLLPQRFQGNETAVFFQFSQLIATHNPLDLGLGAPDFAPPKSIRTAIARAAMSDDYTSSQYVSSSVGHPRLLKAVSSLFSKLLKRNLNPDENVVITEGATSALYASIHGHTSPGDEWIVFEPFYNFYIPMIRSANGIPKFIRLKPMRYDNGTTGGYTFNKKELSNAFNEKTKGIIVNTPHNPLGKVFTLEELTYIADLAKEWNVLVIYDEVYQFLTYDNKKHVQLAALPGMFERTITIGSAGKIFSATGYRIGWAYGDSKLINNVRTVQTFVLLNLPGIIQEGIADALEAEIKILGKPYSYFERFRRAAEVKRNKMYELFTNAGMSPILPESGYFIVANWTTMGNRVNLDAETDDFMDVKFNKWLIKNINIHGLPMSGFFSDNSKHIGEDSVRFTLLKSEESLAKLEKLLEKWKSQN